MSKPIPPRIRLLFRVWAAKLERGLLDPGEVESVAAMLRRLAEGQSVDELFGIRRPANRPHSIQRSQRLLDMARMRLPKDLGGDGLTYKQMVDEAVKRFGKAQDTIIRDYKSKEGKDARKLLAYGPTPKNPPRRVRGTKPKT